MPPFDPQIVSELISLNKAEKGVWRLKIIVTGGDAPELFLPEREGRLVMLLGAYNPPPCKPLKLGIFPHPFHLCHAHFKSLAHLNRLYVTQEARRQGVDDCITLTESGIVLEASFGNLFWTVGKTFYTPSPELPLYFGVTIEQMVLQAKEEGYEIVYTKTPLEKLPQKAHYYRTGSMAGVVPIASIGSIYFAGL